MNSRDDTLIVGDVTQARDCRDQRHITTHRLRRTQLNIDEFGVVYATFEMCSFFYCLCVAPTSFLRMHLNQDRIEQNRICCGSGKNVQYITLDL